MKILCLLLFLTSSINLQAKESDNSKPAENSGILGLYPKIRGLIKDKSCKINSQCMVIGLGSKSCGGPQEYLIYSRIKTSPEKLGALVRKYNNQQNLKSMDSPYNNSTCSIVTVPQVGCLKGICTETEFQFFTHPESDQ